VVVQARGTRKLGMPKWHKPRAAFSSVEYKPWFEAWSAEGVIGLGPARDYDWIHTRCARL